MNESELLTTEEVSRILCVQKRTVQHWLRTGVLPGFKVGLRDWRVRREDLDAHIERQKNRYGMD